MMITQAQKQLGQHFQGNATSQDINEQHSAE